MFDPFQPTFLKWAYAISKLFVHLYACVPVNHPNPLAPKCLNHSLGIRIMTPEPIPTAYFIYLSHHSVCLYVYFS